MIFFVYIFDSILKWIIYWYKVVFCLRKTQQRESFTFSLFWRLFGAHDRPHLHAWFIIIFNLKSTHGLSNLLWSIQHLNKFCTHFILNAWISGKFSTLLQNRPKWIGILLTIFHNLCRNTDSIYSIFTQFWPIWWDQ